jgi:hypothetical protein
MFWKLDQFPSWDIMEESSWSVEAIWKGWSWSLDLTLSDGPNQAGTFPPLGLMMETDQISESYFLEKLKMMENIQIISRYYTPLSETFSLSSVFICLGLIFRNLCIVM